MRSDNLATMPILVDAMDDIIKERKHLEGIMETPEFATNRRWQWMKEWVAKTDKEHLYEKTHPCKSDEEDAYIYSQWACAFCFATPRFLLHTSFSFCDEYGCGMMICPECAKKIGEIGKVAKEQNA